MGTGPVLQQVECLAGKLAADLYDSPPDAVFQIQGAASAGKTSLLVALAERLREKGMAPVLVSPPARAPDSAGCALVDVWDGLSNSQTSASLTALHDSHRPWAETLADVPGWIESIKDKIVLLCDEPMLWPTTGLDHPRFNTHATQVVQVLVEQARCRRVIAGMLPESVQPSRLEPLRAQSEPDAWLNDANAWGSLTKVARALAAKLSGKLQRCTPLQVRLLVAHAALTSLDDVAQWLPAEPNRNAISRRLASVLEQQSLRDLAGAWAKLALLRRPFHQDLVEKVVGKLEPTQNDVLRKCLLYNVNGHIALHDTLRRDAREHDQWLPEAMAKSTHRILAEYWHEHFRRRKGGGGVLRDEMEAFHHATHSGDPDTWKDLKEFFSDQLDLLGREVSKQARRTKDEKMYALAADIFERAIDWDENDDYAHHYYAFNFDVLGMEAEVVENHFGRAIEINPSHAWWWSRYLCFLVTRGRTSDAANEWGNCLDALGLPSPEANPIVYESLHLWIAQLLIHRGQLDFAQQVLDAVPAEVRRNQIGIKALDRRLRALLEVRRRGAVFPASIPPEEWWQGPHRIAKRNADGKSLTRWVPGRIDSVDERGLDLFVAELPRAPGDEPTFGHLRISRRDFDCWSRDDRFKDVSAGRFVEIGWYGRSKDAIIIRVHRASEWIDPDLPPLFPDPVRYLRRQGLVR